MNNEEFSQRISLIVECIEMDSPHRYEDIEVIRENLAKRVVGIAKDAIGVRDEKKRQTAINKELNVLAKDMVKLWFEQAAKGNIATTKENIKRFLFNEGFYQTAITQAINQHKSVFNKDKIGREDLIKLFVDVAKFNNQILFKQQAKSQQDKQKKQREKLQKSTPSKASKPTAKKDQTQTNQTKEKGLTAKKIQDMIEDLPKDQQSELVSNLIKTYTQ